MHGKWTRGGILGVGAGVGGVDVWEGGWRNGEKEGREREDGGWPEHVMAWWLSWRKGREGRGVLDPEHAVAL